MKKFIPHFLFLSLFILVPYVKGAQSLSAGSGAVTLPNTSPWQNDSTFRVELRVHGSYTLGGTAQSIFSLGSYSLQTSYGGASTFFFYSNQDSNGNCTTNGGVTAGTDAIMRFQRYVISGTAYTTAEAWNSQTGVALASSTCTQSTAGNPNDGGANFTVGPFNGDIAYIRMYTTTVAVGTVPGNTTCNGNFLDYEFEGNGSDCSGHSQNMTMTGASYVTTPVYNPAASFNPYPTLNTFSTNSGLLQLTSTSFSSTDNATLIYSWIQIIPIPATGTFSSSTISNPTFTSAIAGTYGIQLTVTDSLMNATVVSNTHIGAVDTLGACPSSSVNVYNCIVNDHLSAVMHNLIGPLVIANGTANPWNYGDNSEIPTLQNIANVGLASPYLPTLGTAYTGTVSAGGSPTNGAAINGLGTTFTTQTHIGDIIEVAWNSFEGSGTGRGYCQVQTITSDTNLTCNGGLPFPSQSGLKVYRMANTGAGNICNGLTFYIACWVGAGQPANSFQYYDVPLALYRLYFRTGDSQYLTDAQQFADIVWQWVLDHGNATNTPPRNTAMISQYYRALEIGGSTQTNRMVGLLTEASYFYNSWYNPSGIPNTDLRDSVAYPLWTFAIGAKTDPNSISHSQYCGYLTASTSVQTLINKQNSNGGYSEHQYSINPTYVDAPLTFSLPLVYEGAGWRQSLNLGADEATYEVLNDTSSAGCNSTTLAASLLTTIKNYAGWLWNYTRDSVDRGVFYENDSQSIDQSTIYNPGGSTSCNITNGSTALVCTGTSFVTSGYVISNPFIGLDTPRTIYKLNSCADDTHCILNMAYGSLYGEVGNLVNSKISLAPAASLCGARSSSTYCFGSTGDRNLTRTLPGRLAWVFNQTGITQYQTWATELYSATLGGPTSGLTSASRLTGLNLPCSGFACDGYSGDSSLGAATCGVPTNTVAPCNPPYVGGQQNILQQFAKGAGEAWGAPGIDNALAWDLTNSTPPASTFNLSGNTVFSGKFSLLP